jgi:hypothetical protein
MNRFLVALGVFGFAVSTSPLAFAAVVVAPPGLPAGSSYRLVFATDTAMTGVSSDIDVYNNFVTTVANTEPKLTALGTTWRAIASTSSVDARDNTGTNPASMGVPIYNMVGQLIATSNADLWDGTIAHAIFFNQHGQPPPPGQQVVWTGTQPAGIAENPLGMAFPAWGEGDYADNEWVFASYGTYGSEREFLFYGLSGVLTVVPEPSTIVPAALGAAAALAIWITRRRSRASADNSLVVG